MSLSTVALLLKDFYRLVGSTTSDGALVEQGESADDVAYLALTHGTWRAQLYMIGCGMGYRWRKRDTAWSSWTGADATDGGRYHALPTDFLRLSGSHTRSSLVQANGDPWGVMIDAEDDTATGNGYYLKNDQVWLCRGASPPSTLYLDYHARHAEIVVGLATIDFPIDARPLIVSEAADFGASEAWFPLDNDGLAKIARRVERDRWEARKLTRQSRSPRRFNVQTASTRFNV